MMSTDEIKVVDPASKCEMIEEPTQKSLRIGDVTLECVVGDIVAQPDMEAVVNAANAELREE